MVILDFSIFHLITHFNLKNSALVEEPVSNAVLQKAVCYATAALERTAQVGFDFMVLPLLLFLILSQGKKGRIWALLRL